MDKIIMPNDIIGAVVEEVISEGECIECIKLRLQDGCSVDVNAYCEESVVESWMEVM